jgi:hypothetical protein
MRQRIADLREELTMMELDCLLTEEACFKVQLELAQAEVTLNKLLRSRLRVVGGTNEDSAA